MDNILINYLTTEKDLSLPKAFRFVKQLATLEQEDPMLANDFLEDNIRHGDMLKLLKEYILTEKISNKIKISRSDFETHFHIVNPLGRGRKPKGYYENRPPKFEDMEPDGPVNYGIDDEE